MAKRLRFLIRIALVGAGVSLVSGPGCTSPPDSGPVDDDEAVEERQVQPPRTDEGSESPAVLIMGTSLTEGLGLTDPDTQAWPARIEARAAEAGIPLDVRNAGLSGETSAGALRRVDWVLEGRTPDVFVLETGANDGLRGLSVSAMEANIDSIFQRVRARAPDAHLVLVAMEAPPNLGPDYVDRFREAFVEVAARHGASLTPFLLDGVAGDAELNQADGIHPTAEGHRRMAANVWPVLDSLLVSVADRDGSDVEAPDRQEESDASRLAPALGDVAQPTIVPTPPSSALTSASPATARS